jgi:DnaK suppressor protein
MTDYSTIKAELEKKLKELILRANRIEDDLSEPGDDDWEDRAKELEDVEVKSSVGNLALKEVQEIRQALHQIENGTYGRCTRCGKPIAKERLKLLPYAATCIHCV